MRELLPQLDTSEQPAQPELDPRVAILQSAEADESQKEQAFAAIYQELRPLLLSRFRQSGASPEDAEDLLQSTMIRAWNGIDGFKGGSKLSTWITTIAINQERDAIRKRRIDTTGFDDLTLPGGWSPEDYFPGPANNLTDPALALETNELLGAVGAVIKTMRPAHAKVFKARLYGAELLEIAEESDISYQTTKFYYHAASKTIDREFQQLETSEAA